MPPTASKLFTYTRRTLGFHHALSELGRFISSFRYRSPRMDCTFFLLDAEPYLVCLTAVFEITEGKNTSPGTKKRPLLILLQPVFDFVVMRWIISLVSRIWNMVETVAAIMALPYSPNN